MKSQLSKLQTRRGEAHVWITPKPEKEEEHSTQNKRSQNVRNVSSQNFKHKGERRIIGTHRSPKGKTSSLHRLNEARTYEMLAFKISINPGLGHMIGICRSTSGKNKGTHMN